MPILPSQTILYLFLTLFSSTHFTYFWSLVWQNINYSFSYWHVFYPAMCSSLLFPDSPGNFAFPWLSLTNQFPDLFQSFFPDLYEPWFIHVCICLQSYRHHSPALAYIEPEVKRSEDELGRARRGVSLSTHERRGCHPYSLPALPT